MKMECNGGDVYLIMCVCFMKTVCNGGGGYLIMCVCVFHEDGV